MRGIAPPHELQAFGGQASKSRRLLVLLAFVTEKSDRL